MMKARLAGATLALAIMLGAAMAPDVSVSACDFHICRDDCPGDLEAYCQDKCETEDLTAMGCNFPECEGEKPWHVYCEAFPQ